MKRQKDGEKSGCYNNNTSQTVCQIKTCGRRLTNGPLFSEHIIAKKKSIFSYWIDINFHVPLTFRGLYKMRWGTEMFTLERTLTVQVN